MLRIDRNIRTILVLHTFYKNDSDVEYIGHDHERLVQTLAKLNPSDSGAFDERERTIIDDGMIEAH